MNSNPHAHHAADNNQRDAPGPFDILQANKLYHPVVGGIETVVRDIATGLTDRGHNSSVLAATPFGCGGLSTMEGVRVRKTASLGRVQSVPLSPAYPVRLFQESMDVDIVHHHLPNPLGPIAHTLTPSANVSTVVTYHSDIVRQQTALQLYAPILRSFLNNVERILVTSPPLLEHSEFLAPHREKCTVIPLSIDIEAIVGSTKKDDGITDYGPAVSVQTDATEPIILFVGRLNYYKGVEYLIDAMKTVDAKLLVIGEGERREALERRTREKNIADRIRFFGHVDDDTLAGCYEAADVFVLPSVEPTEAFGIVQVEAMAHEVPVVNTALPTGVPWVSPDGETGLTVPPRDSDALAGAITELLSDDEQRCSLGRNGRERVLELFTRENMLDRIEAVYADVLGNRSGNDLPT